MAITAITGTPNFEVELSETVGGVTTTTTEVVNADFEVLSTATVETDVNGAVLASMTSTITAVAGGKSKEVIEKTEKRIEKDANGNDVEVDFVLAQTLNFDANGVIETGTKTIDGFTQTLGAEGIVTAEAADTSVLGTAISGTALATAVDIYSAIDGTALAADATIYATEEKVGDDATVKTLFDGNGKEVGSEDTFAQTWDGVTYTTTNHKDKDGETIGSSGGDGTNSWSFFEVKSTNSDDVEIITETGSDSYGGEARSWTYVFNAATGDLISGSEIFDGITTTFGANWSISAESVDLTGLTDTMTAQQVIDTPDAIVAKFSLTTDTLIKKEAFDFYGEGTVAEEYTFFDTNGATLGYANVWADDFGANVSFHDANDVYLGNYWSDAEGRSGESAIVTNTDNTVTESGSYSDGVDGGERSSYEWKFDAAGVMTSGTEVRGSTTYNYGADWAFEGAEVDVSGMTVLDLDALFPNDSALNDLVKDAFFIAGQTYYITLEEYEWGGSLVTYLNADGSVKGYADTYSDDWDGDGTADSSGTTFMNADWGYVGSSWTDIWGSGQQFNTNNAADGSAIVGGYREFGTNSWKDPAGNEETRSFDFIFDTDGDLRSGVETSSDGVETTYGADWTILGQKADVSGLGSPLSDTELAGVPTSIQSALTDGNTYSSSQTYDWGTDTTYYNSDGKILGYSNSSDWSYGDEQGSNKGYHDANWNWLGGSWEDKDADGTVIRSGYNSTTEIFTGGVHTGYVEKGGFTEGDLSETYEWNYDINWTMTGGTEVRGTTTLTYGENWTLEKSEADTSKLATLDNSTLPDSVVTALFASDTAVIKFSEETFAWDAGSKQITYYDANNAVVGYKDEWSDSYGTGSSYMDENWNHIGSSWDDEWGSGSNFTVRTDVNGDVTAIDADVTAIKEVGTHTWENYEGVEETRSFEFNYDANYDLISGTEVSSNGETVTFGANWEVTSVSRVVDLTSEKITELSVADLNGIPTALHAEGTTYDTTTGAVTASPTGKETYSETVTHPWGTQKTYLDSAGQILGYSDAWSDDYNDDQIIDSIGTSFQDADWNHLGSTFEDNFSKGFNHTVETFNLAGEVTGYIETGSRTEKATGDLAGQYTGETTTTSFTFDINYNLLSGTETRGTTTTVFKAGWEVDEDLSFTNVGDMVAVDVSGLPASVKDLLFAQQIAVLAPGVTELMIKLEVTTFDWGGSQTAYYDAQGKVLGYSDTYGDDYNNDGNDEYSGVSYMDANFKHLGGSYSNDYDDDGNVDESGTFFTVVDEVAGTITESGTNVFGTETRSFSYVYNDDYSLKSGSETSSNGTTTTYGADWTVTNTAVDPNSLGAALGANDLVGIPSQLQAVGANAETFSVVVTNPEGSFTTYYDVTGKILGYQDSWSFQGGSGSSFMDANNDHIGGSHSDAFGSFSQLMTDNGDGTFTETGTSTHINPDGVVEGRQFVFQLDGNKDITSGTEIEASDGNGNNLIDQAEWDAGKTTTLGAKGAFGGVKLSLTGAQTMDAPLLAVLPSAFTAPTGATKFVDEVRDNGPDFFKTIRTFINEAGDALGTQEIFSEPAMGFSGTWSMDANGNHVGDSRADDHMSFEFVRQDTLSTGANPVKTGYTETYTDTFKNADNSDGAGVYTGDTFTRVETFDLAGNFLSETSTRTIDGVMTEESFDASGEMIGSYAFVGGVKIIDDPYELFQTDEFEITTPYLTAYAKNVMGIETFIDDNRDGIADVFVDDYDGDGASDMQMEISNALLNVTVFAPTKVITFIKDAQDMLIGVSMKANGFEFKMFGPLTATAENDLSAMSGTVAAAYVYDEASGELVASSESLGIPISDINTYIGSRIANGEVGSPDGSPQQSIAQLFGGAVTVIDEVISGAAVAVSGDGTRTETYKTEDGSMVTEVTGTDNVTVKTTVQLNGTVSIVELETDAFGKVQEVSLGGGVRTENTETGAIIDIVTGDQGESLTKIFLANGTMREVFSEADGSGTTKAVLATGEEVAAVIDADGSFVETTSSRDSGKLGKVEVDASGVLIFSEVDEGGNVVVKGSGTQTTDPDSFDTVRTVFEHDQDGNPTQESVETRTSSLDGTITRTFTNDRGELDYTEVETAQPDGSSNIITSDPNGNYFTKSITILENGTVRQISADSNGHVFAIQDKEMVYDASGLDRKHTETRFDLSNNVIQETVYSKNVMTKTQTDPSTGNTILTLKDQDTGDAVVTETNLVSGAVTVSNVADIDTAGQVIVLASTGTRTVDPNTKVVTVALNAVDALGVPTGVIETTATAVDGEVTKSATNTLGVDILSDNIITQNDGTEVRVVNDIAAGVKTETISNSDGTETITVTAGNNITISEKSFDTNGHPLINVIGTGTISVDGTTGDITESFVNNDTGKTETTITDADTGTEVTETSSVVGGTRVVETTTTIETNANGLPTTKIVNADGSKVELFTNEQGVTEKTLIGADNQVTVLELVRNEDGSISQDIVATGTVAAGAGNSEIFTLETSDNVDIVRTVLATGAETIVATDDSGVANTIAITTDGEVTSTFEKDGNVVTADAFTGNSGIGFDENLLPDLIVHDDGPPPAPNTPAPTTTGGQGAYSGGGGAAASPNASFSFEWTSGEHLTHDDIFISNDFA